jgi:serine/threonine protein kinase/tetratricopeptide (TPR) repeat protein
VSDETERLFERALALKPEDRTAFVEDACRGDPRLQQELLSLLGQAGAAEQFFDRLTNAVFSASFSSGGRQHLPPQPPDPDLHVGEVIGQYRILSLIARGGMGTVYRAHDARLARDVALKFLPAYLAAQPDAEERLLMEARAAAGLEHPNVCSIHQIGETDDGRLFIAMAYYEGETLKERLLRGPLSLEESVATAVQIVRALAAAHARGIIHRDVKPGNVMLGSDGTVRLLDFGLATVTDATLTRSGMTPGTVAYMSPEQARGDALDPRTDLWSLGVLLYEMLAGVRPFRGENARKLLQAILHEDPEPISNRRPELPGPLARVVERLLGKDPATRYGGAGEVLAALARALPSEAGSSQPRTRTRRRAALVVGSTILLVALVGTVVWPRWRPQRSVSAVNTAGTGEPSIAVLPLANLSPDPQDAALARGMTEELIATLATAGDVRVIASTSASAFKNREMDVRSIADSLGVSNILEGDLQKIGPRLRVQVRLVDGRNGSTRWSQAYDREFKEVFSIQDEIARAVAGELALRFDKDRQLRRHHTRNPAAYELYLRGSDPLLLRSESGVWKALGYFQQAIAADSTYAAAHAGLALVYIRRVRTTIDPGMPLSQLFALAEDAAAKAVALDDSLPEAHYALGRVREAMLDFPSAETEIRRAIALDPTRSIYHRSLALLHGWAGRAEEALAEARRALETDPLNPYAHVGVAGALFTNHRYDEALAQLDRVAAIQPPLQGFAFVAAQCYAKKQMWSEAIAALRPQAEAGEPTFIAFLGYVLAHAGQRDEASRILADLLARREKTGGGAFQVGVVYAGLGDFDQAFAWLDKSVDDRSINDGIMGPTFEDLQGDPRFERLRRRLGLQKG